MERKSSSQEALDELKDKCVWLLSQTKRYIATHFFCMSLFELNWSEMNPNTHIKSWFFPKWTYSVSVVQLWLFIVNCTNYFGISSSIQILILAIYLLLVSEINERFDIILGSNLAGLDSHRKQKAKQMSSWYFVDIITFPKAAALNFFFL